MTERPILFTAPMVRAILEGRKTQTRRIVSDRHIDAAPPVAFFRYLREKSPYGQPGDRLWVRETLRCRDSGEWEYGADHQLIQMGQDDERVLPMIAWAHHKEGDTCVSIHMPRWASRITLELTGVRVERLQEISTWDCEAEGRAHIAPKSAREVYRDLWDSLNADRTPWASNPWVWVLTFKRVTP